MSYVALDFGAASATFTVSESPDLSVVYGTVGNACQAVVVMTQDWADPTAVVLPDGDLLQLQAHVLARGVAAHLTGQLIGGAGDRRLDGLGGRVGVHL